MKTWEDVSYGYCCVCVCVRVSESVSAPPPPYSSVTKRVRAAKQQSNSNTEFVKSLPAVIIAAGAMLCYTTGMLPTSHCGFLLLYCLSGCTIGYVHTRLIKG